MTSFLLLCTMIGSFGQVQTMGGIESIQVKQLVTYVQVVGISTYTTAKGVKVNKGGYMNTDISNCRRIQK